MPDEKKKGMLPVGKDELVRDMKDGIELFEAKQKEAAEALAQIEKILKEKKERLTALVQGEER